MCKKGQSENVIVNSQPITLTFSSDICIFIQQTPHTKFSVEENIHELHSTVFYSSCRYTDSSTSSDTSPKPLAPLTFVPTFELSFFDSEAEGT